MPMGPGKYDAACTVLRESTGAQAVVAIVLNGVRGTGFSVQVAQPDRLPPLVLADLLDHVARELRAVPRGTP